MKRISYLILFIGIALTSCQKEIEFVPGSGPGSTTQPPKPVENAANPALAGTTWRLTASTSVIEDNATTFTVDLFALMPSCALDNTITYNPDFTCTSNEGPTKCDPSTPQTETGGKWTLSPDKKTIVVEGPANSASGISSLTAEVLQLDNDIYKVRYVTYVNGPKATTTTTYARVR
ncbi:MAG: lipocalin family protein [Pedobacter sp.]|nr:lipocalin family protein [Pedobacter sp.]MDQ8053570.1 lipocalin family protein [Pedobacter sp.]